MKKLFLIALSAFVFSCSSDDNSSNDDNNNNSALSYVRGKMDGSSFDYTFNNTATDTYTLGGASGFSGLGFDRWYYYAGGLTAFNPPNFAPSIFIGWNNMYFGENGDEAGETEAFYDTVSDLPSNYLTAAQDDSHMPGLEISFEAENGNVYSSKYGSQSGSTLTVDGSTEGMSNSLQTKTVWGKFSCKLYNQDDPSDMIEVTDGKYKVILSEFNW